MEGFLCKFSMGVVSIFVIENLSFDD
jgi:hypothetical protein